MKNKQTHKTNKNSMSEAYKAGNPFYSLTVQICRVAVAVFIP